MDKPSASSNWPRLVLLALALVIPMLWLGGGCGSSSNGGGGSPDGASTSDSPTGEDGPTNQDSGMTADAGSHPDSSLDATKDAAVDGTMGHEAGPPVGSQVGHLSGAGAVINPDAGVPFGFSTARAGGSGVANLSNGAVTYQSWGTSATPEQAAIALPGGGTITAVSVPPAGASAAAPLVVQGSDPNSAPLVGLLKASDLSSLGAWSDTAASGAVAGTKPTVAFDPTGGRVCMAFGNSAYVYSTSATMLSPVRAMLLKDGTNTVSAFSCAIDSAGNMGVIGADEFGEPYLGRFDNTGAPVCQVTLAPAADAGSPLGVSGIAAGSDGYYLTGNFYGVAWVGKVSFGCNFVWQNTIQATPTLRAGMISLSTSGAPLFATTASDGTVFAALIDPSGGALTSSRVISDSQQMLYESQGMPYAVSPVSGGGFGLVTGGQTDVSFMLTVTAADLSIPSPCMSGSDTVKSVLPLAGNVVQTTTLFTTSPFTVTPSTHAAQSTPVSLTSSTVPAYLTQAAYQNVCP